MLQLFFIAMFLRILREGVLPPDGSLDVRGRHLTFFRQRVPGLVQGIVALGPEMEEYRFCGIKTGKDDAGMGTHRGVRRQHGSAPSAWLEHPVAETRRRASY